MFLFLYLTLLIAKKTNTSVVVIGCREKHNIYKSFDMHFNLDNKEYSLTLENREKKTKKQKSGLRYALPATALFGTRKPQAVLVVPKGLQLWTSKTSYVKI